MCYFFTNTVTAAVNSCDDYAESACKIEIDMDKSFVKQTEKVIARVSVANPDIADVQAITPRQILVIGKKAGSTNLIIWPENEENDDLKGEEKAQVYDIDVYVSFSLIETIHNTIRRLVPGARINIQRAKNGVILDGEVESQYMLERVLGIVRSYVDVSPDNNLVTVAGCQQVQLEVKIAEVSRSGMKQMGLGFLNNNDWSIGLFTSGSVNGKTTANNSGLPASITESIDSFGNYSRTVSGGGISRDMGSSIQMESPFSSAFQIVLHAVEDNSLTMLSLLKGQGLSRILASPTLVALSGQEAEFMVGGEYPYPVQGEFGQNSIEYKRFGIMLNFTPTVVGKETISIQVQPEVSSLDYSASVTTGGVVVPGLRTRKGSTTLQLKDGQTFAMAGLINEEVQWTLNKVPFLGDIPVLGTLFTSKEFQRSESELVIIVTPRLVRAMNPDEVPPLPGESEIGHVNDTDFFLKNRVSAPDINSNKTERNRETIVPEFSGKTGFSR